MLTLSGVHASYGDTPVLYDISLQVAAAEIVAVLGSNGAGKTTLLRCISGLLSLRSGRIEFEGQDLARMSAGQIVGSGLVHVPEGRQLFAEMTVLENLEVGSFLPAARRQRAERMAWVFDLFPVLKARRTQLAGTLSGGEQQMLAIARGLMSGPRLLMLDEPSLGIAPVVVEKILTTIQEINRQGATVVLVEQNAVQALEIAHRAYVLEKGRLTISGTAAEVMANEEVKRAYLGLAS